MSVSEENVKSEEKPADPSPAEKETNEVAEAKKESEDTDKKDQ